MEQTKRRTIVEDFKVFNPSAKEHDFVEVVEWSNGDGWDIYFNETHIALTLDQLSAINLLTQYLQYYHD